MGAKLGVTNDIFHVHGICKMGKKKPYDFRASLLMILNQRGLAKIILPAEVCNALVTSTEIVRLK